MLAHNAHWDTLRFSLYDPDGPCALVPTMSSDDRYSFRDLYCWGANSPSLILGVLEEMLCTYRCPFFLVRVGNGWARFGYLPWALRFYHEAKNMLGPGTDATFDAFLEGFELKCADNEREHGELWSSGTVYRPWKSVRSYATPHGSAEQVRTIQTEGWAAGSGLENSSFFQHRYSRASAVCDRLLERDFSLPNNVISDLVQAGNIASILPDSRIKHPTTIWEATSDTLDAYSLLQNHLCARLPLTTSLICELHRTLARTLSKLNAHPSDNPNWRRNLAHSAVPSGVTRTSTKTNLVFMARRGKTQFCPHEFVDAELEQILLIYQSQGFRWPPYCAAAWLFVTFAACAPFENLNDSMARLLASIPLIQNAMLPLSIPVSRQDLYHRVASEAIHGPSYTPLEKVFQDGVEETLTFVCSLSITILDRRDWNL